LAANGNVVVVNITYRVGVFGGFELGDLGDGFDDNLCLRDQIAALVWLRDNIAAFSGDAGRVIVFGESAGATSVLALISSPAAEGLFTRAIAQSPALPLLASVASTPTLAHGLTYGVDLLPRHPIEAAQGGDGSNSVDHRHKSVRGGAVCPRPAADVARRCRRSSTVIFREWQRIRGRECCRPTPAIRDAGRGRPSVPTRCSSPRHGRFADAHSAHTDLCLAVRSHLVDLPGDGARCSAWQRICARVS
jgi:hypothetical protein